MRVKHSKIKNTGILFELLVRKIASDVLDGKTDSFAVKIMREHFHSKSELGKELQLYRAFFNSNKLSEVKAFNMLDLILERRATLNEKLLEAQKFLLIREIKQHCDLKSFMSGRVPSYKVYASVYKLFETIKNKSDNFMEIDDLVSSRFVIIEHLKGELKEERILRESNYSQLLKDQPEEIRLLSYKFLLESFNEKYSVFSDRQKALLREYINNGTDIEKFSSFVKVEASKVRTEILSALKNVKNDVTRIKINEVVSQLNAIQTKSTIKDNYITALLIAYQIASELKSLR